VVIFHIGALYGHHHWVYAYTQPKYAASPHGPAMWGTLHRWGPAMQWSCCGAIVISVIIATSPRHSAVAKPGSCGFTNGITWESFCCVCALWLLQDASAGTASAASLPLSRETPPQPLPSPEALVQAVLACLSALSHHENLVAGFGIPRTNALHKWLLLSLNGCLVQRASACA